MSQLDVALRQVWYQARSQSRLPTLTELAEHRRPPARTTRGKCDVRVRNMGIQLFPYTQDGAHGRWFEGANVRFDADLVVLELDELESKKDLQVILPCSCTSSPTRSPQPGRRAQEGGDHRRGLEPTMMGTSGGFIEAGYRRARKYNGAFVTGTQGVDDYYRNEAATAALNNADWMFMLRQKPNPLALEKNSRLAVSAGLRNLLETLHTEAGPIPRSSCTARWATASAAWCWTLFPAAGLHPGRGLQRHPGEKTGAGLNVDEAIRRGAEGTGLAHG